MAHTAAVFTLGTWVRTRIEKRRQKEKEVRVPNRLSAWLWLGQGCTPDTEGKEKNEAHPDRVLRRGGPLLVVPAQSWGSQ
jgi:hypothetical protein